MGLIAMQKVAGSNPISRLFAIALHVGGSGQGLKPEARSNHPAYHLRFGASSLADAKEPQLEALAAAFASPAESLYRTGHSFRYL
jgi:hypothetical protein